MQIEEINVEMADARQSLKEAEHAAALAKHQLAEKIASSATVDTQLLALTAAQAKNVSYIEELDERLAEEQATREEQARLISQLQSSLTERTSKESGSALRAMEAEKALSTLKQVCLLVTSCPLALFSRLSHPHPSLSLLSPFTGGAGAARGRPLDQHEQSCREHSNGADRRAGASQPDRFREY